MSSLRSVCVAIFLLMQAGAPFAQTTAAPAAQPADDGIAIRLDAAMTKHYPANQPGAAVIVVRDGKTILRKAYGLADIATMQAMTADMSFRLGSISKQFTATAILMLADEGKLALSDDIRKFLPDFPNAGAVITIEHLLTHSSGIPSYTSLPGFFAASTLDVSVTQMIDRFKDQPREFGAGQRWSYSNSNYFLLGAIIEKVSGLAYADFLAQNIFIPLAMNDTAYEGRERSALRHVNGYVRSNKGYIPSAPLSMSQPYAAGALVSTVDDLARWDAAITNGKLLKVASWNRAFTPYTLNGGKDTSYGYGWEIGKLFGSKVIAHGGDINGFAAYALRIPDHKLFVAVLANTQGGDAEAAAAQAASIAMRPQRAP